MSDPLPNVSTAYAVILAASLGVLFLILCVKTPEMWRSGRRFLRQSIARHTRKDRMLADPELLQIGARRIEGTYCFESVEAHHSPAHWYRPSTREFFESETSESSLSR